LETRAVHRIDPAVDGGLSGDGAPLKDVALPARLGFVGNERFRDFGAGPAPVVPSGDRAAI
jgi:hypothetical protein